ncbi:hypothetical protein [Variovorax paradoxus]|uniref:hypothetical protein n=1 Tax=Variovorax paradoxus TaxID=34073 RepID=UPI001ABBE417
MSAQARESSEAVRVAARTCARNVAIAVVMIFVLIGLFGWVFENRRLVGNLICAGWAVAKHAANFGGSFWFAATAGILNLAFGAWGICVFAKIYDSNLENSDVKSPLNLTLAGIAGSLVLWPIFLAAADDAAGAQPTIYQSLAIFALYSPLLVLSAAVSMHIIGLLIGKPLFDSPSSD